MAYCPLDGKEMETVEEYPDTGTDVSFGLRNAQKDTGSKLKAVSMNTASKWTQMEV